MKYMTIKRTQKVFCGTGEMAQWLKTNAALKEDPSLSDDSQLHVTPTPRESDISGLYSQNSYIHTHIQTNTHN